MIASNPTSSRTQTHFHSSSNLHKTSFLKTPSHISFDFRTTHLINPIKTTHNSPPKSAATNCFYTPSPEETLYDLLGIPESGTLSEIKRAYKQMALKYHPDVSALDRAEENTMRFIKVQEAYETLSDPDARARYDSSMEKAFSGKKGSRFEARWEEKSRWKQSWQVQVAELKRSRTVDTVSVDEGGRKSWASRIREERRAHGSTIS